MKQVVSYASVENCDEKKLFHMRHIPRHIEKKEVYSYASITQTDTKRERA